MLTIFHANFTLTITSNDSDIALLTAALMRYDKLSKHLEAKTRAFA